MTGFNWVGVFSTRRAEPESIDNSSKVFHRIMVVVVLAKEERTRPLRALLVLGLPWLTPTSAFDVWF